MRRSFSSLFILSLLLPLQVLAEGPSVQELLALPFTEVKPVNFSLAVKEDLGDVHTTLKVSGARETQSLGKLWANISLERRSGSASMRAVVELRAVNGTAYVRLKSVEGADSLLDISSLRTVGNSWFTVPMSALSLESWTMPPLDPAAAGSVFTAEHVRFIDGNSYKLSPSLSFDDVVSFLKSVAASVPVVAQAGSDVVSSSLLSSVVQIKISAKVDTTRQGEFRFFQTSIRGASLSIDSKVQRQMYPVYVEVPKNVLPLTSEPFQILLGARAQEESTLPDTVSDESSTAAIDSDVSSELSLPSDTSSASARRAWRLAKRYLVDVYGSDGTDIKLTVRVADHPATWDSLSAFRADFGTNNGVLFVYSTPTIPSFSTKGAFEALDVLFFDSAGKFVSAESMQRCETSTCPEFAPSVPVSYALEVPYGFVIEHKIDALSRLSLKRYPLTVTTSEGRAAADRLARKAAQDARQVGSHTSNIPVPPEPGHERVVTLATLLSAQIRAADLRAALEQGGKGSAVRILYRLLANAQRAYPETTYLYILQPTDIPDTFRLVVDSYTFAPLSTLDVNMNGKLDADEQPSTIGTAYLHSMYTSALLGPVVDTTLSDGVAAYVPVRDEEGKALAVLAVVEQKDSSTATGAGTPENN